MQNDSSGEYIYLLGECQHFAQVLGETCCQMEVESGSVPSFKRFNSAKKGNIILDVAAYK